MNEFMKISENIFLVIDIRFAKTSCKIFDNLIFHVYCILNTKYGFLCSCMLIVSFGAQNNKYCRQTPLYELLLLHLLVLIFILTINPSELTSSNFLVVALSSRIVLELILLEYSSSQF